MLFYNHSFKCIFLVPNNYSRNIPGIELNVIKKVKEGKTIENNTLLSYVGLTSDKIYVSPEYRKKTVEELQNELANLKYVLKELENNNIITYAI